jgi:hypothetical protein
MKKTMQRNNFARDADIRNDPAMTGRDAYEASCKACPFYHDGERRKSWDQLSDAAQWSWLRVSVQ